MLDKAMIDNLRKLEKKATPRPWDYDRDIWWENTPGEQEKHGNLIVYPTNDEGLVIAEVNDKFDKEQGKANAELFTAMRNILPELLDAAEEAARLKVKLEEAQAVIDTHNEMLDYQQAKLDNCQAALQAVWNDWKDSYNANDPEAEGYETLQQVKQVLEGSSE